MRQNQRAESKKMLLPQLLLLLLDLDRQLLVTIQSLHLLHLKHDYKLVAMGSHSSLQGLPVCGMCVCVHKLHGKKEKC